ncbi:hypothetical protein PR202_ga28177 [Eleusine coracana subsp. coracana]|uniref:Uncharacterized protein n=1 Tax=Eleusine coracana subsp. coracana TaxID=191504 RepID=A0AAV5DHW6_ELECO|nr:hypothetical protein PR202_ga28177 [Eleusine coracana subsp. coracana]
MDLKTTSWRCFHSCQQQRMMKQFRWRVGTPAGVGMSQSAVTRTVVDRLTPIVFQNRLAKLQPKIRCCAVSSPSEHISQVASGAIRELKILEQILQFLQFILCSSGESWDQQGVHPTCEDMAYGGVGGDTVAVECRLWLPRAHWRACRPISGCTWLWDALAFSGPAPERINGELAKVGFVSAIAVEAMTRGDGPFAQAANGTGQA